MSSLVPESGPLASSAIEVKQLAVSQPSKMKELNELLLTLESFDGRVSEIAGEDRSGDMGGAGGTSGTQGDDATQTTRAALLEQLPPPAQMQQQIERHIRGEIKQLEKLSRAAARSSQPGAAFHLNELYAKIRRLNSMLASLVDASIDVLKRLFVRIFIDKQTIFSS